MKRNQLVSLILPLRGCPFEKVEMFFEQAKLKLDELYSHREIIFVLDGEDYGIQNLVERLLKENDGLRFLLLTRDSGTETCISAGLEMAIGDMVVVMLPGKDPISLLPEFIEKAESRDQIVIGQRKNWQTEGGLIYRLCKSLFHFAAYNLVGTEFPKHTTFFIAVNRQTLNAINQTQDRLRHFRAITTHIGMPITTVAYELQDHSSLRSFWESVNLSIDILFLNSRRPLRIITFTSLMFSALSLLYVGYVFAIHFFKSNVAEGWTTLSLQMASGFFFLFLTLSIFSEYLSRLLIEVRDRPLYYVKEDKTSSKSIRGSEQRNITRLSR